MPQNGISFFFYFFFYFCCLMAESICVCGLLESDSTASELGDILGALHSRKRTSHPNFLKPGCASEIIRLNLLSVVLRVFN